MAISLAKRIHTAKVQEKKEGDEVIVAGFAADAKEMGKIAFITLRDRSGTVQIVATPENHHFKDIKGISKESVIAIRGKVKASKLKSGAKELQLEELEVITASQPNLPIDFSGKILTNLDKRLDFRILDLRNPKILAIFKIRSRVNMAVREFLLSQSQQLYKQMMLAAGFEKVFEIGPTFRAEKSHTTRHMTEFTHFDFEMAYIDDEDDVLKVMERMFVHVMDDVAKNCRADFETLGIKPDIPALPFPRVPYRECIEMLNANGSRTKFGEDITSEDERILGKLI